MSDIVRDTLEEIRGRHGRLTADIVVQEASDKHHPLHDRFEWDDGKAGAEYRLDQARTLIRSVRITVTVETRAVQVPMYVHDPSSPTKSGYVPVVELQSDEDQAREAIAMELARAMGNLRRARDLAVALGRERDLDVLIKRTGEVSSAIAAGVESVWRGTVRQSIA